MFGNVTDIQRFCLNDGPGIRTCVFFKGCNLHCSWCHNPETIDHRTELHFYEKNCIGCGKCTEVCPAGAQQMLHQLHFFDRSKCIRCGACASVCYAGAMAVSDKKMSVDDIMREIVQDKIYYDYSGGGVTLTGGEVLCQASFAAELAKACRSEHISVGIESNLCMPFESLQQLLPWIDLVMLDIKLFGSAEHKKWTGMDNHLLLSNIRKLSECNIPMIVRTPLIPGATDSDENLLSIAEFLSHQKNIRYYELLNFNPLGESKYKSLQKPNPFEDARPLPQQRLNEILELLKPFNLTVKLG